MMGRLIGSVVIVWSVILPAMAQGPSVESTIHNLSVSGPGEVRSLDETEICWFCHVPHTATVREPLWGHALSKAGQYKTPKLQRRGVEERGPQPDGSSRLCLSCHDGTVALGDVGNKSMRIRMRGMGRLVAGRPGFIGTDLSGSHPVSITVPDTMTLDRDVDMGVRPRASIDSDPDVRLDPEGKVQCTSCHDPHSDLHYQKDRVPHFFVKSSVTEACLVCHELR